MAGNHTRVNILVEGQTEETFVRELLAPHLTDFQVYLTARIIETSKGHKGGVVSYGKIERQVRLWCMQDQGATVTTLFDVDGLPADFPGFADWNGKQAPAAQVGRLEANLAASVAQSNLIPYLQCTNMKRCSSATWRRSNMPTCRKRRSMPGRRIWLNMATPKR